MIQTGIPQAEPLGRAMNNSAINELLNAVSASLLNVIVVDFLNADGGVEHRWRYLDDWNL